MDFMVVIPVYNEEKRIGLVLERLLRVTRNVIVVDDGSVDRTREVVARYPVTLLSFDKNVGKGAAVREGIRAAKTPVVVLIDGDNQHAPEEIPRLLSALEESDLVIGSRFPQAAGMPAYRYWANRIIRAIVRLRAPMISDPLSGFRAFRRTAFLDLKEDGFTIDLEILFAALRKGLRVSEVPISVSYPTKAESKFSNPLTLTAIKEYLKLLLFALRNIL